MKGENKYESMSEDTKRMLRGEPLICREDYLCSEEQDQIDRLEERIGALERDRALLLVYAKAARSLIDDAGPWTERSQQLADAEDAAWWALIDAGLLAGDDDTAAARQEAGEYEDLPEISAAGQAGLDQWYRERDARRIEPEEAGE